MSEAAFSGAIQKLYAAAGNPSLFKEALRAVEDFTGSTGAVIGFTPKYPVKSGLVLSGRFDDEQCATYARDYAPICRRIASGIQRPDLPYHYDALILSEKEMDRDPVYNWFQREAGVRYYVGARLPDAGEFRVDASLQRTARQGHVQKADIEAFQMLTPHLSQAVTLSHMIGGLSVGWKLSFKLLDVMPQALFLIGSGRDVIFANAAGEAMIRRQDGLDISRGRFVTARSATNKKVAMLVDQACLGSCGGWTTIEKPGGLRPYAMLAAPFNITDDLNLHANVAAIVVIVDPETPSSVDAKALIALFGLTPRESEIAICVAGGQSLAMIAAESSVSIETVRQHLKAAFRKMDLNRQQDLVSLVRGLDVLVE